MVAHLSRWAVLVVLGSLGLLFSPNRVVYAQPLVLDSLLAELQVHNPTWQAQRVRAQALTHRVPQASALPNPSVSLTYQPFPVFTARGTQRSLWRVEQAFPYPGTRDLRAGYAEQAATVATWEAATTGADLALHLKQTYYQLYQVAAHEALIVQFEVQLRAFEEAATVKYEVGQGTQQAILQAQLERNRLQIRLQRLAEDRVAATHDLARLLSRPDTTGLMGTVTLPEPSAWHITAAHVTDALMQRPETQALAAVADQAETQLALAHAAYRPDFMVSITYADIAASDEVPRGTGRDALMLGIGVKVPLWRTALRAGVTQARLQQQEVAARQEALEVAIRTEIVDLKTRLLYQQEQLTLLDETLLPQAETTLEAALSAYTTGRTDFLNLLDAERMLFDLQWERVVTYVRLLHTTALLERAIGVTP